MSGATTHITYSRRYEDDDYEYRNVTLDAKSAAKLPFPSRLLTEMECLYLGVQQSSGWEHYMIHNPEPHILMFRRKKEKKSEAAAHPTTGCLAPAAAVKL